jgi:hypothetical protein
MKPVIILLLLFLVLPVNAEQKAWVVTADQWQRPRHGERLVQFRGLADGMRYWIAHPGYKVLIRYPGGEVGQLWSQELKDWLVALGIPAERIQMAAGLKYGDRLYVYIMKNGEQER